MDLDMPSATGIRQAALEALLPTWIAYRDEVAAIDKAVKAGKDDLKRAREDLADVEKSLAHVGDCHLSACMKCEELVLNGTPTPDGNAATAYPDMAEQRAALERGGLVAAEK